MGRIFLYVHFATFTMFQGYIDVTELITCRERIIVVTTRDPADHRPVLLDDMDCVLDALRALSDGDVARLHDGYEPWFKLGLDGPDG